MSALRVSQSSSPALSSASTSSSSKDAWLSDEGYDEYGQLSNDDKIDIIGAARRTAFGGDLAPEKFSRLAPRQNSAPPLPFRSPPQQQPRPTWRRESDAGGRAAAAGGGHGGGSGSQAESGYESQSPATLKKPPSPSASAASSASIARHSLPNRCESSRGRDEHAASGRRNDSSNFLPRPRTADAALGSSAAATGDPAKERRGGTAAVATADALRQSSSSSAAVAARQLQTSLPRYDDFARARTRSVSTDVHSARLSTVHSRAVASAAKSAEAVAVAAAWTSSGDTIAAVASTATEDAAPVDPRERFGRVPLVSDRRRQADGVGRRRAAQHDPSRAVVCASSTRERTSSGEASVNVRGAGLSPKQAAFLRMQQSTAELAKAAEEWQRKMTEAAAKTARRKRLAGGRSYRTAALMKQATSLGRLQASIRGTAMRLDERDRSGGSDAATAAGGGDGGSGGGAEARRQRPWAERAPHLKRAAAAHVEIHYEKCLPASQWIECKPKTFVTNHKYGNAYEIRVNKKTRAANPRLAFLWENDCQVWLLEKRREVAMLRQQAPGRGRTLLRLKSGRARGGGDDDGDYATGMWVSADAAAVAARSSHPERGSLRFIHDDHADNRDHHHVHDHHDDQKKKSVDRLESMSGRNATEVMSQGVASTGVVASSHQWKLSDGQSGSGPMTSDVFEKFDNWAKDSRRRRVAALKIQTHVRRWLVTSFIDRLKITAVEKHGVEFAKLAEEYKSLLRRIQRRLGVRKPSAPFSLLEFKQFLDRKEAYEVAFTDVTKDTDGALLKKDLLKFLNACKFYPLEREVNLAFDKVFRGCGTQADVVVLLDSSASIGQLAFDFQLNFVRDLARHLDLGRDKVRLAVVPYNDNVFGVIDFDSYTCASDLAPLLEHLTYDEALTHGKITRTDLALRFMVDMMAAASRLSTVNREGSKVPKICIAFTDGSCYYTQLTDHWAEKAKTELSINMFAIAVGKAPEKGELLKIASSPANVLDLYDYKTLHAIKSAIIGQSCLRDCPLCQFTRQQSEQEGGGATGRCADERRGLYKSEALELLWMLYPPPAAGLRKYRQTTWVGSMVESNDVVRLTKLRPGDADFRTCLRKVIEEQLDRHGELTLPSETGVMANKYTSVDEALECINRLCLSKLPAAGLTNSADDDETWRTLNDRSLLRQARATHVPHEPTLDG